VLFCVQFLSSGNFLARLSSFHVDSLNDETVELVHACLESLESHLELATRTGNTLVTALYAWAHAMCSYYKVYKTVIPIKVDYVLLFGKQTS